jgi:imidazolonepropionase-like amidohydrolase
MTFKSRLVLAACGLTACLAGAMPLGVAGQQSVPPMHGQKVRSLIVRNAMVIYGSRRPPAGPYDILVQDGVISQVGPGNPRLGADVTIDATGKYVMPGIVNTHMHWHEERQSGMPQPIQYERNLYLAAGVTTAREVGGDFVRSKQWQAQSNAHTIVSPRILVYPVVDKGQSGRPDEIRAWIRAMKERGADGLKIIAVDRDQLEAILDEAHRLGLRTTAHIGVEETTARDYIELGVNSIEHFYGIADATLNGVQHFPPDMNYSNEIQRFARAGELWAQADRKALSGIVDLMIAKHVGWSPTLSIYEAGRDALRAQNQPWFKDYLHPSLEAFFRPSLVNHGSFLFGWTSTQEARWREQFRIWMDVLHEFGRKGGLITTGDDAGYVYSMYGFGISRELELHEEAGFEPLEVIEHATWNGARMLGLDDRLGKIREGFIADLLVVNGNPLQNLKLLNPYGTDVMLVNGRPTANTDALSPADRVESIRGGGIEWTIKDGIPYHVPTLMSEVREMVASARQRARGTHP